MTDDEKPPSRVAKQQERFTSTLMNLKASSKSDPAMKAVTPDTLTGDDVTPVDSQLSSRELLKRLEENQIKVVDQLIATAEVNGELAGMLEESVQEDERTRKELAQARQGYRRMRTAVYTLCAGALVSGVVVGFALWHAHARLTTVDVTLEAGRVTLERVDRNVQSLTKSQTTMSTAVTMKHKADLNSAAPDADEKALEAVLDAQEATAQAEIDIAASRKEPPPPKAVRALKAAKREKMRFKHPVKAAPPVVPLDAAD